MPPLGLTSSPVKCELQGFRRCIKLGKELISEHSMLLGRQRPTCDGDILAEHPRRPGLPGPVTSKSEESELDMSVTVGSGEVARFLRQEHCPRCLSCSESCRRGDLLVLDCDGDVLWTVVESRSGRLVPAAESFARNCNIIKSLFS
jgi:hypothetical protein